MSTSFVCAHSRSIWRFSTPQVLELFGDDGKIPGIWLARSLGVAAGRQKIIATGYRPYRERRGHEGAAPVSAGTASCNAGWLLPGDTPHRETVLEPGDLITHVTLPPPVAGSPPPFGSVHRLP